jgi:hypothetical protein
MRRQEPHYGRMKQGLAALHNLRTPEERRQQIIQLLSSQIAADVVVSRQFQVAFGKGLSARRQVYDWVAKIGADIPVQRSPFCQAVGSSNEINLVVLVVVDMKRLLFLC